MKKHVRVLLAFCLYFQVFTAQSQNNYFIDGYHGGVWGHYPAGYTGFISDMLDKNPFWKISLEIEPVTWDNVKITDASNYTRFQQLVRNQSLDGRVEFVNPGYGQSYLFNVQGESVIRQFEFGIRKIREHFPEATFTTYSTEEPCFTSALPQILKSFGYKYASLKNPNTCWGGYTTAFGGELVNWTGPDGSALLTVPRYETEKLLDGSTWQTTAWNNDKAYLQSARDYGILSPIGMCLQDAGWKNGPWLGQPKNFEYQTWKQYITNVAGKKNTPEWRFTQENIQVSLVWGAQILQKLAQNVRASENKLIIAEKISAIQSVIFKQPAEADRFKEAWENLLLAQHHDSWIVPYNIVNRAKKLNWADQVKIWTDHANRLSDSVLNVSSVERSGASVALGQAVRIYNTVAQNRNELVRVAVGKDQYANPGIFNAAGNVLSSQMVTSDKGDTVLLFKADVPSMGFQTYFIKDTKTALKPVVAGAFIEVRNGKFQLHTDKYEIRIDPAKGGAIESLLAKKIGNTDFVAAGKGHFFNEMKGYFYNDNTYHSSADQQAVVSIVENGPLRIKIKIAGNISVHPFTQYVTLIQGEEKIDIQTKIDWQGNPGIGQDYNQHSPWKAEVRKKAFYDDSYKLSAFFPLNLQQQKLYKNAAFDVLNSKLSNTRFNTWDSIKNNIIVNWVDVVQQDDAVGMALLTDHTTSYSHGENGELGLTLQYSGMGLWGRNYSISGPSEFKYALLPHAKQWARADIWTQSLNWNEPLQVRQEVQEEGTPATSSLIGLSKKGYEISALQKEGDVLVFRVFNASGQHEPVAFSLSASIAIKQAALIELNGTVVREIVLKKEKAGMQSFSLTIPEFGIRTVKLQL